MVDIIELFEVTINNRYPQILCEYLNNRHLLMELYFSPVMSKCGCGVKVSDVISECVQ